MRDHSLDKATLEDTRRQNRILVLRIAYEQGEITRADIARQTGLTRATASAIVGQLEDEGFLRDMGTVESTGGKPPTLFEFVPSARGVIALDLSRQPFVGAIHDLRGDIIDRETASASGLTGAAALAEARRIAAVLAERAAMPIIGVGIGAPGIIDDGGCVRTSANLDWTNVALASTVGDATGLPVRVDNDTGFAALAEYASRDVVTGNLILIELAVGIGAGIVLNGAIHRGDASAAGEIGHLVADPGGGTCTCGNEGCLETVAGLPRVLAEAGAEVVDDLDPGNPAHIGAVRDAAARVGRLLAFAIGILDVHDVVLAGPLAPMAEHVIEPIRAQIKGRVLAAVGEDVSVSWTKHSDDIVLLGAALSIVQSELDIL